MMHAVIIRSRTLASAAASKDSAPLLTDFFCASHALVVSSATIGRAAGDGCSAKVGNHRFTALPQCYELTAMLRRMFVYALGASGRARRESLGF